LFFAGLEPMVAFNKSGLLIEFTCERDEQQAIVTIVNMKATNSTISSMSNFVFQAAVPKVSPR